MYFGLERVCNCVREFCGCVGGWLVCVILGAGAVCIYMQEDEAWKNVIMLKLKI